MLRPRLQWSRQTDTRFLKGSGVAVEGPVGSVAIIRGVRDEAIPEGLLSGVNRLAEQMEIFARQNAPWTDRTGAARAGLAGFADSTTGAGGLGKGTYWAGISHGVDYGIWLELRYNGRFAIVGPTQEAFASRAADIVRGEVRAELTGSGTRYRHKSGRFTVGL